MTQPYYTAAGTPAATATAGPVDPAAGGRVKAYTVLSGLLGLIPVLTVFKVITTDQGAAIGTFTQAALGLAGAFGFAFVARKTSNQVKDGTFAPAPELPAVSALEQLAILRDQAGVEVDRAVATVKDGASAMHAATQAATSVLGLLPGGGAAAKVSGELSDLLNSAAQFDLK